MPKRKTSVADKAKKIIIQHKSEFMLNNERQLFCKLCHIVVKCDKNQQVDSHVSSKKHFQLQNIQKEQPKIFALAEKEGISFPERVTKAFLSANIPLKKLQNAQIRELFKFMGHPLPSESSCRNKVEHIAIEMLDNIKERITGERVFLIFDESMIGQVNFANILIGILEEPQNTFLIECKCLEKSLNANDVCQLIYQIITRFSIESNNFALLLSDAARYMTLAGRNLKIFFPKLFHVTCLAHLLHNCCLRVKLRFADVDFLIASIKALTLKNKQRRELFKQIGMPPQPIVTRWGSWLEAVEYYARNFV